MGAPHTQRKRPRHLLSPRRQNFADIQTSRAASYRSEEQPLLHHHERVESDSGYAALLGRARMVPCQNHPPASAAGHFRARLRSRPGVAQGIRSGTKLNGKMPLENLIQAGSSGNAFWIASSKVAGVQWLLRMRWLVLS